MSLRDHLFHAEPGVTLYCGDCREILPMLTPAVDLVLTSPPYNLGSTDGYLGHGGDWHRTRSRPDRKWSGAVLWKGYGSTDDALPWPEYEALHQGILKMLWSLLSERGAIYYNHRTRVRGTELWTPLALNPGLPLRQIVTWARAGGFNSSPTYYMPTSEWVMIFARDGFRLRDLSASGVGDVWAIPQRADSGHPAPFPLDLALRAIGTTPPGVVLDPFAGSGTTLRAAKDLGREAIGIEIDRRYCEMAVKRLGQGVLPFTPSNVGQPALDSGGA